MSSLPRLFLALLAMGFALPGGPVLAAEIDEEAPTASIAQRRAEVEARLNQARSDASLNESARATIIANYTEALGVLANAEAERGREAFFGGAARDRPGKTRELQVELDALRAKPPEVAITEAERNLALPDLEDVLMREESIVLKLRNQLAEFEGKVFDLRLQFQDIPQGLLEADSELRTVQASLAPLMKGAPPSAGPRAERTLLQARELWLEAKLDALKQEQVSAPTRLEHATVMRDTLRIQERAAAARLVALAELATERLDERVRERAALAEEAGQLAEGGSPALKAAGEDARRYYNELEEVAAQIRSTFQSVLEAQDYLVTVSQEHRKAREILGSGDSGRSYSEILELERRRLQRSRSLTREIARRKESSGEVRLAAAKIDAAILKLDGDPAGTAVSEGEAAKAKQIREIKRDLLRDLEWGYSRLLHLQGSLGLAEQRILSETRALEQFLDRKLFWAASSPRIGLNTFADLPSALQWAASPSRIGQLARALGGIYANRPVEFGGLTLLWLLTIVFRRRLKDRIQSYGTKIRHISTDRFGYTLQVLGLTLLRSLPAALLVGLLGYFLVHRAATNDWLEGLGVGLLWGSLPLFATLLVREITRKGGLVEAHFRWSRAVAKRLHRVVPALAVVEISAFVLIAVVLSQDEPTHVHSLARLTFIFALLWRGCCLVYAFHPTKGIQAAYCGRHPDGLIAKTRVLWLGLLLLAILVQVVFTSLGYFLAALHLSTRFKLVVIMVVAAVLVHQLLLRWFRIRERKMALRQLIEKRTALREAQREAETDGSEFKADLDLKEEESSIDLVEVGVQTRRLLRSVVVVGTVVVGWLVLGGIAPLVGVMEGVLLFWGINAAEMTVGLLIAIGTYLVAKDLPGILQVTILQNLPLDSGSRYSIVAVTKYVVIAVGTFACFSSLGLEWSRLGWIAAALSVGLGFGLQEIVANFVCGIVLLFERPIRVGDVVTVGEVSGSVSKIRMRATTITDWDRKEFIVPNKEFITGRLLNWTLSSRQIRVTLHVGVAYGTDTELVRSILADIALKNPDVLEDPAPIITFRSFGESSLDFELRCFLPDTERRLRVYHEINSEIHRRFLEEGVEIPFPQRDLHMRSGSGGSGSESGDGLPASS